MTRAETVRRDGATSTGDLSMREPSSLPARRTSSFAAVPAHLYTPSMHTPVASFFTRGPQSGPAKQTPPVLSFKRALLAHGYRVAFLHAVIAVLVNHIRRTFTPWLGAFLF